MGVSSKTLRRRGFTVIELLVVMAISSMLLLVIASLFKVGMWEIHRSSGRIDVVRRGRQAIDQTQRYLASACQPGQRIGPNGSQAQAIFGPDALDDLNNPNPESYVRFWTAIDHLNDVTPPSARQLQMNPTYFAYEVAAIPGFEGRGQDLVVRRYLVPSEPNLPTQFDVTANPRFLARALGVPSGGSYVDGFVVRHLREGAVQIQVNVSSDLISDRTQANKIEDATPMRIKMSSIYQLPFYNVQ